MALILLRSESFEAFALVTIPDWMGDRAGANLTAATLDTGLALPPDIRRVCPANGW